MPATETVTIAIGRNRTNKPELGEYAWRSFREDVRHALVTLNATTYSTTEGAADWNGVPETTHVVVASLADHDTTRLLAHILRRLAAKYEQDAIALTFGRTALLLPSRSDI